MDFPIDLHIHKLTILNLYALLLLGQAHISAHMHMKASCTTNSNHNIRPKIITTLTVALSLAPLFILQQDKDPKHSSKVIKNYFKCRRIISPESDGIAPKEP